MRARGRLVQIARKVLYQGRLHLRRHLSADLLFGQVDGYLRRVAFQFQACGLAGRLDFARRVLLNPGQIGRNLAADALPFRGLLTMCVSAQSLNICV